MAVAAPVSMRLSPLVRITASSATMIALLALHAPSTSITSPASPRGWQTEGTLRDQTRCGRAFQLGVLLLCGLERFAQGVLQPWASDALANCLRPIILSHCTTSSTVFLSSGSEWSANETAGALRASVCRVPTDLEVGFFQVHPYCRLRSFNEIFLHALSLRA